MSVPCSQRWPPTPLSPSSCYNLIPPAPSSGIPVMLAPASAFPAVPIPGCPFHPQLCRLPGPSLLPGTHPVPQLHTESGSWPDFPQALYSQGRAFSTSLLLPLLLVLPGGLPTLLQAPCGLPLSPFLPLVAGPWVHQPCRVSGHLSEPRIWEGGRAGAILGEPTGWPPRTGGALAGVGCSTGELDTVEITRALQPLPFRKAVACSPTPSRPRCTTSTRPASRTCAWLAPPRSASQVKQEPAGRVRPRLPGATLKRCAPEVAAFQQRWWGRDGRAQINVR